MSILESICKNLDAIRSKRPLVHSITNYVVMNETANAVLCIGALPIMSHAKEEVEEMAAAADALVLNIGTLSPDWIDAMEIAGRRANSMNKPVILDPVGAGATAFRTSSCRRLLESVKISIIRGNAGEIAALADIYSEVKGVESIAAAQSPEEIAKTCAAKYDCTAAVTGQVDVVSDGCRVARISNGDAMLGRVVGTGCMSTVIIGCFAGVESDSFMAAVGGLTAFGIAGELAANESGAKPGTFHVELYNALDALSSTDIRSLARLEISV